MSGASEVKSHALMGEWLRQTVRGLVDREDVVKIETFPATESVTFEVHVDRTDFGKLIGKEGVHAESIRTILKAMSRKHGAKYVLNLIDPNPNKRRAPRDEA